MGKVQFNCRLDEDIAKWIAEESERQTETRGAKFSQADVVSLLVNEEQNAREVADAAPPKMTKKARLLAELEASDPVGAARPDVDLGNFTLPSAGSVSQGVTLDATGPKATDGRGKVSMESWRANRKPLLKPGDRK